MPPKPITDNISPVWPSDLLLIFPGNVCEVIEVRSAGKSPIAGATAAVVLMNSRLFIINVLSIYNEQFRKTD
jgi:hypothetical protein